MASFSSDGRRLLAEIFALGLTIDVVDDRLRLAGAKSACAIVGPRIAAAKVELLELLREPLIDYARRTLPRLEDIPRCAGGAHYAHGRPCELCASVQAAIDALPPLAFRYGQRKPVSRPAVALCVRCPREDVLTAAGLCRVCSAHAESD